MIRKLVTALVLVAVALLLVSFAVANRQTVTVSFDPFDQANPALVISLPLYQLIFILLIGGVLVGGCAAWLRQAKWRRRARRAEQAAEALRAQASRRPGAAIEPALPVPAADAPRLIIPPPAA
jgi:uncharacterized integral membrane protein